MVSFQKGSLTNLELNGIVDLNAKLGSCTAQEIVATFMLHSHHSSTMQQVLNDLNTHQQWWDSFVMGPVLPTRSQIADRSTLAGLRDLWAGWNCDTLYLLSPNINAVRSLRTLAKGWGCTDITVYSPQLSRYYIGIRTRKCHLVSAWWQRTVVCTEEMDFSATYDLAPFQIEQLPQLRDCSPQMLVAGLFLRNGRKHLPASTVLQDLQAHSHLWSSFAVGPVLPNANTELENCLRGLRSLPDYFWIDALYLWAQSLTAAKQLQTLSHNWRCTSTTILDNPETARLLALPKGPLIVVVSW